MTVLAKVKVTQVTDFGNNNHEMTARPVTYDSEENKSFSLYTPNGEIKLLINNPATIGFFEAGKEYFVEFTKVE